LKTGKRKCSWFGFRLGFWTRPRKFNSNFKYPRSQWHSSLCKILWEWDCLSGRWSLRKCRVQKKSWPA
jgi:hypothetical protein